MNPREYAVCVPQKYVVSANSREIGRILWYSIALCIQRYVRAMLSIAESADVAAL